MLPGLEGGREADAKFEGIKMKATAENAGLRKDSKNNGISSMFIFGLRGHWMINLLDVAYPVTAHGVPRTSSKNLRSKNDMVLRGIDVFIGRLCKS